MLRGKVKKMINKISYVDDPIKESKNMISFIQSLVGIHNVFGDENRHMTIYSVLAGAIFGGTFVYVGTISQVVYLVQVFPDKVESFKAMNCISAVFVPFSKFIFMWSSRARLRTVFEMSQHGLSSIPDGTATKKMMSTLHRARYVSWMVVAIQSFSHITYLLIPFLFTCFGNDRYLPTTPGESYGLSPKYETPFYEITFILTCIATAFSAINQTGYIVLLVTLLTHEVGHFYAITETMNQINKDLSKSPRDASNHESIDDMLRFCVKHHQFLIQYHHKIKELYNVIFGVHFLMMTIVVVTTLQTMNSWDIRNTILTGFSGVMPLFIYCFGGELLISAEMEMCTAIYTCGWELMDVKQARMVLLMLCLSQHPLYLTAANIFVMNRETFGNVVQVVYKVYAVFN